MRTFLIAATVTVVSALIIILQQVDKNSKTQFTCGVPFTKINKYHLDTTSELVFNPKYKWETTILKVFFIDDLENGLIENTLRTANEWSKYSKIKFKLTKSLWDSEIRVSFREHRGYLSVLGNSAKDDIYFGKPTLWLQNLDLRSSDEFKRVVLHEFGHAIGLEHELQSPASEVQWDSVEVYLYYDTAYKWSKEKVNENIFKKINTSEFTKYDPLSIMIYEVPSFLTKNKKGVSWPDRLSEIDKLTINKYYPK